ncbi:ABC transporter substrate-binding protein [Nocardioidaceae bacterium]|nr:ABC transporter substrate-binding protein [Nocardioidaceae bacterium]
MKHPRTRRGPLASGLTAALLALTLAACGGDPEPAGDDSEAGSPTPSGSSSASSDFPVTLESGEGEITLESQPERIVSLSPSATESLFAIGAGEQVVAADEYSNFPAEAPTTDLSGFDPNVEAILSYEPDLVIASADTNDLVAGLDAAGVPTLISGAPADIESGYDNFALLGMATGRVDETAAFVSDLRGRISDALDAAPQDADVRVYHELDDTYFAASSNSFIGSVYEAMGATNIADGADSDGSGFPQLTAEAVIAADPQLIVITDQVSYTAEDVAQRPGWGDVAAVRSDSIVTVDADIASRWGPRLPQFIDAVAEAMNQVPAVTG